ncbi:hypothetical protein AB4Y45_24525 [Paraburkholderia sp. EG287A]|uniref:hypothetical protein n=1 Tax=unclassified Paraburkholderia TaxID=2615204 RepID=UPI0034D2A371
MAEFDTDAEIEAWIAANGGIDALRTVVGNGQMQGRRAERAKAYLQRRDAREVADLARRNVDAVELSASAAEDSAREARRSADASERAADAAAASVKQARIAWIVALVSVIVAAAIALFKK